MEQSSGGFYDFWLKFRKKPWARRSLIIFARESLPRKICIALTHSSSFLYFVQLLIVSNCISMMLVDPLNPDSAHNQFLEQLELIFTIAFTAECVANVVAVGLYVPDPNSGRMTEISTLRDWMHSWFGCRGIPSHFHVGNIQQKASRMTISRFRAIVQCFYTDAEESPRSSKGLLDQIEASIRESGTAAEAGTVHDPEITRQLSMQGWVYLPKPINMQFVVASACLDAVHELFADVISIVNLHMRNGSEAAGEQKQGATLLREHIFERAGMEGSIERKSFMVSPPVRRSSMRRSSSKQGFEQAPIRKGSIARTMGRVGEQSEVGKAIAIILERRVSDVLLELRSGDADDPAEKQQLNEVLAIIIGYFCELLEKQVDKAEKAVRRSQYVDADFLAKHRVQLVEEALQLLRALRDGAETTLVKHGVLAPRVIMRPEYLASGWNRLDLIVVFASWLTMTGTLANVQALRLLRTLKPLRTLKALPSLQMLISVCLNLGHELVSIFAIFLIFLLWVTTFVQPIYQSTPQQNGGLFTWRCAESSENAWFLASSANHSFERLCSTPGSNGRGCDEGLSCYDSGVNPMWGLRHFDDFGASFVTLLQCATLDKWSIVLYQMQDATGDMVVPLLLIFVLSTAYGLSLLFLNIIVVKVAETILKRNLV